MIRLVPKNQLDPQIKEKMDRLVATKVHANDKGPINNWSDEVSSERLLVVLNESAPIGIIYHGGPNDSHDVGWWFAKGDSGNTNR